ncbi:hypothetical protein OAE56_03140 [Verrucomicrobiales bacterium]|nr:hypothetical protein [Verrucomicrobiales bacterium]
MNQFSFKKSLFSLILGVGVFSMANAAPPEVIDLGDLDGSESEDVIIPIPQEIFNSLDKLGDNNWKQQAFEGAYKLDTNRSRTALIFGFQISEGFILVQAKDKDGVMDIGRDVIKLAGALGVESAVDKHAFAIINEAERENWSVVRREFDKTRQTVIEAMREMRDDSLADLVSVGGWLGGTRALSSALKENYSKEGSDLLNQPLLLEEISKRYEAIPKRKMSKGVDMFAKVTSVLNSLQPLMTANELGLIEKGAVTDINKLTDGLATLIYEGK